MTQEDQLDISHQPSNSVCDQINDDSLTKSNSKNITTTSGNQKILNDGMSSIVRSNMGAAVVTESKENELNGSLLSSPSSPDQLSLIPLPSIENNKNQNQFTDDNIPIRNVVVDDTNIRDHALENQSLTSTETVGLNCDNGNSSKMTVIKSQNNNENIREILHMKIENSDKATDPNNNNAEGNNKLKNATSDSENKLKEVENVTVKEEVKKENLESNKNEPLIGEVQSENSSGTNKDEKLEKSIEKQEKNETNVESVSDIGIRKSKRKSKERSVSQDIDDPIARLNALKANISNALKEVKAVLIEHGEPVLPEKPEKSEKQEKLENDEDNPDNGVVNFRFVKKVRRRSTFEEDKNAITEIVVNQVIDDNKIKEESEILPESSEKIEKSEQSDKLDSREEDTNSKTESQTAIDNRNEQTTKEITTKKDVILETKIENEIDAPKSEKITEKENQSVTTDVPKDKADSEQTEQTSKIIKKVSPKVKKGKNGEASTKDEDKKPIKTKKLVKRNSQDDTLKTTPLEAQVEFKSDNNVKNNQKDSTAEESIAKKKTIKTVSNTKKIVKTAVSSALDKVLATTNLKIPNDRRASIAAPKASDQSSEPAVEKRRSSTSRLILKNKQTSINEAEKVQKKSTDSKKLGETSQTKVIEEKTSQVLSSENKVKPETVSEKIKADQETIKTSTSSQKNSLPSIKNSEKENVAPSAVAQSDKKKELSTTPLTTKLEEKSQSKSETAPLNENKTVNTNPINTAVKTEMKNNPTEENKQVGTSKSIESSENVKISSVKNVDQPTEQSVQSSIQKQTLPQKSEITPVSKIPSDGQKEISIEKSSSTVSTVLASSNATSVPSNATAESKALPIKSQPVNTASQPISSLPNPSQDSVKANAEKTSAGSSKDSVRKNEKTASISTTPSQKSEISSKPTEESAISDSVKENEANSKSPLVRNAITAKLAELKRPPFKMPVVTTPNLEAAKIHPLVVLHITPPKNISVSSPKKTQQATVSNTEELKKPKTSKANKSNEDNENYSGQEETTPVNEKTTSNGKKRKSKKVVIRRVKRRLSVDAEEKLPETEIEEKEIQPKIQETESIEPEKIPGKKSCLKVRAYEPDEVVMYADRIKKTIKWKKAKVLEKITSISYKLDVEGEEKPAHISYIKKYTDKKVHFGAKEYLEIDYAQDEDDEEEEPERYNIWARV